jgi:hypothetical protein
MEGPCRDGASAHDGHGLKIPWPFPRDCLRPVLAEKVPYPVSAMTARPGEVPGLYASGIPDKCRHEPGHFFRRNGELRRAGQVTGRWGPMSQMGSNPREGLGRVSCTNSQIRLRSHVEPNGHGRRLGRGWERSETTQSQMFGLLHRSFFGIGVEADIVIKSNLGAPSACSGFVSTVQALGYPRGTISFSATGHALGVQ